MEWKYFAAIGMLYNILLLINCYIGNSTTKCHSGSMSDNRDLTETFHQKISSYYKAIAFSLLDISSIDWLWGMMMSIIDVYLLFWF